MKRAFRKTLSANDTGATKSHQAGMLIPKTDVEFRKFLGDLDPTLKNPRKTVVCLDEHSRPHELNFIYYNNKLHDPHGTRNEYRLTGLTAYMRQANANMGDEIEISRVSDTPFFQISLIRNNQEMSAKVVLRGWRRVH